MQEDGGWAFPRSNDAVCSHLAHCVPCIVQAKILYYPFTCGRTLRAIISCRNNALSTGFLKITEAVLEKRDGVGVMLGLQVWRFSTQRQYGNMARSKSSRRESNNLMKYYYGENLLLLSTLHTLLPTLVVFLNNNSLIILGGI